MIEIKKYDYSLPKKLIANFPEYPRDYSRFLVYESNTNEIFHKHFFDLNQYLQSGDLLIFNRSRVFPARLFGKKLSGGRIELLLLEPTKNFWRCLIGGKILVGEKIVIADNFFAKIIRKNGKEAEIKFNVAGEDFWRKINQFGKTPIPPYIKNTPLPESELRQSYQTVYAEKIGSAAAPTAGLHFSKKMIGDLKRQGVEIAMIDLHVGLGTFTPINKKNIRQKKLHQEKIYIPCSTIRKIIKAKNQGRRIIAVGTTTVRALESAAREIFSGKEKISGSTNLFIQPGFKFKIVDALVTNFHLPRSSLMMLVAAFLQFRGAKDGREKILELYQIAIEKNYRFYSFGDAMMII